MGRDRLGTAEPKLQHWRQCGVRSGAEEQSTPPYHGSQCAIITSSLVVQDQKLFLQEAIPTESYSYRKLFSQKAMG